jgi:small subunit ribosomal protein S8
MTDPIADMLTRIRNASIIGKPEVLVPMSKLKHNIAKILVSTHWLEKVEVVAMPVQKNRSQAFNELKLTLRYKENGQPVITSLKRISKPSRRVYVNSKELPRVLNNMGLAIISTPQGLMTNKEAGKKKLGGEVICEIY